ncbi:class I SAM-dependent methyltransferase [Sporosarcina thermotolerans]|uniref:Class I SAM-dependent methyltransferase n=1 Tax=Sporosarcina thermotolerans TaxID=633404 RepID=A0AAW9A8X9_9BACL|nr:class I SAM-dependent methyltransferase [Sporosarcina thermotolerans]MDW0117509.1 class I SAM-dependent methyltransferase [Sporosarcina thermotolerans]WHT49677.1 class I SAM-dependent methyltransferase [Sporosarcina thermotolerans]
MTTNQWVIPFYQKQFEWLQDIEDEMTGYMQKEADTIEEQIGVKFKSMLDIGAGIGSIARTLDARGIAMTTLELVPELVEAAKRRSSKTIDIHLGDFYTHEFAKQFDVVSYFDGFGIGSDDDQLTLLKRMKNWVTDDGTIIIDIYNPNYWRNIAAGKAMKIDVAERIYSFDEVGCRMVDSWWHKEKPDEIVTQSLRCYTIDEISTMCNKAGLTIIGIFPGGAMDFDNGAYVETATLSTCLSYRIKLKKNL